MNYAVSICSRGEERMNLLAAWLPRLEWQTAKPTVLIVNNNENITNQDFRAKMGELKFPVEVVSNAYSTLSDACGSQTALLRLRKEWPVIIKWDDDLVPTVPDCFERLARLVRAGFAAAGGMYPRLLGTKSSWLAANVIAPDGKEGHVQFFDWHGPPTVLRRRHLYSSFAYDSELAHQAGGFCTNYSQLCYRHETDFTLRLDKARPGLAVDTAATALHLVSQGGVREFDPKTYEGFAKADAKLFIERMSTLGIDGRI